MADDEDLPPDDEDGPEGDGGAGLERPRRAKNGHHTLLGAEVHKRLVGYFKAAATVADACAGVGVSTDTHYDWMRRGAAYNDALADDPLTPIDTYEEYFRAYYLEVRQAIAESRLRADLTIANLQGEEYPPAVRFAAAKYTLDRTDPERKHRVEVTGADGGPIRLDVTQREAALAEVLAERIIAQQALAASAIIDVDVVDEDELPDDDYAWWSPDTAVEWWPDDG